MLTADDILRNALAEGIIDFGSVQDLLMKTKIEKLKATHPYKITKPNSPQGRWQTSYRDADGKLHNIKASTEDKLWGKLLEVYDEGFKKNTTFKELFKEWLKYKAEMVSPNTITRHRQHYEKYFEGSKLNDAPIEKINLIELEAECNRIVKSFGLSRKEWNNAKTVLVGIYTYAERKGYINQNLMEKVQIKARYRQVTKKTGATQTFNTEELDILMRYLDSSYAATKDASFIAAKVNFSLGLRVGELVALKWEDITDRRLHVVREEVRNQSTGVFTVEAHTKTYTDRYVYLTLEALEMLNSLERQGEFIFMRDGKRLTSRQFAYVLQKFAKHEGVPVKSSHKIRKTYASRLSTAEESVPLDTIRELLGHSSLNTTLGYIYNPMTELETQERIAKALSKTV